MNEEEIREVFIKHGSDKAGHHYHKVYHDLQGDLLEVGVFRGNSMRAWREILPSSLIVGVDLFERIPFGIVRDCVPEDIILIQADSTNPIDGLGEMKFDNIIDDGSHFPLDQLDTMENLWNYLKSGGRYFIEDVLIHGDAVNLKRFLKDYLDNPDKNSPGNFQTLMNSVSGMDKDFIVHDLRAETKRHSVIIELKKK